MIDTPRLHLREFTDTDFPSLFALVSNPEVMRFSEGLEDEPTARARLKSFIHSYRVRGYGKWAVEEKSTGQLIGYCGFGTEEIDGVMMPELGYRLLPEYWGSGLATEAAMACSQYAEDHHCFPRYLGFTHPGNTGSQNVLRKVGLIYVGERQYHGYTVVVFEKYLSP
jgi:[ribosomal protein S5]-alanine N-acetyltransferase